MRVGVSERTKGAKARLATRETGLGVWAHEKRAEWQPHGFAKNSIALVDFD